MDIQLDDILYHAPTPMFWKGLDGSFKACNKAFLEMVGAVDFKDLLGKRDRDLPSKKYAKDYVKDDQIVVKTGKIIRKIENIPSKNKIIISETTKAPWIENGKIIGVSGICLDITSEKEVEHLKLELVEKEAERLKLENKIHKVEHAAQEQFAKIAAQVAHDVRSPTSTLNMIFKACQDNLPEEYQIGVRLAITRIQDITSNFLKHPMLLKLREGGASESDEKPQSTLLSLLIADLLAEKRLQYQDCPIQISDECTEKGNFAFIHIEPSAFRRMLSDLINNSVDACEDRPGKVTVGLEADFDHVRISVTDNGKGMRPELVAKIMTNIMVTEGKEGGHGLGLTHAYETLQRNHGKLSIDSKLGLGTKITLAFPRIKTSNWLAESIELLPNDDVVLIDDDLSIHAAWGIQFKPTLDAYPSIDIKHCTSDLQALEYIAKLAKGGQKNPLLLCDYELLHQELNGLDIIERTGAKRAILVTSHYADPAVRARAARLGTKILPKQLSSDVPIHVSLPVELPPMSLKDTEVVIVDDDPLFSDLLANSVSDEYIAEQFANPNEFVAHLEEYSKEIAICLDHNFGPEIGVTGLQLAEQFYYKGYTGLFLISGESFAENEVPSYVVLIPKGNDFSLSRILREWKKKKQGRK